MSPAFILFYLPVGLTLGIALTAIPLAARGAGRSLWWGQLAASLFVALALAGFMYRQLDGLAIAPWRFVVEYLALVVLPTLGAGWGSRAAVRVWPRSRWVSAVLGAFVGFTLVGAACVLATRGLLPDIIVATS